MHDVEYEIQRLENATKASGCSLEHRMIKTEVLSRAINDCLETGKLPQQVGERLLERLANVLLYDDLSDYRKNKPSLGDYPFLSGTQLARRQYGSHQRKRQDQGREVPLAAAAAVAMDRRTYASPVKRQRSLKEDMRIDENTSSNDEKRADRYEAFKEGKLQNVAEGEEGYSYTKQRTPILREDKPS
ncbi:hypothetical protein [Aureibacillus halotolerans]|uniref:Uncharacterized protein n=1 Tax=Aureibacillus halotolerans TaxID=1508390 RepID=A0A4V3D4V7_9BACI|nr:hypothetical protein [Aureibacillus halotolerans]TDQ37667.1 hypothetical protein EV213_11227 [Aureibacillus halotolerans]